MDTIEELGNTDDKMFLALVQHYIGHLTKVKGKGQDFNLRYAKDQEDWVKFLFENKGQDRAEKLIRHRAAIFNMAAENYNIDPLANLALHLEYLLEVRGTYVDEEAK